MLYWPSQFRQEGWILASFVFFARLWTSISSHLDPTLGQYEMYLSHFDSVVSQKLTHDIPIYKKMKLWICQQYWLRFAGDCSSQKVLLHSEVDWNLRLYETNKGRTDSISTTSHFKKFFSVFRHSFQCLTPKTSVFHVDFLLSTISEERKSNLLRRLF